MFIFKVLIVFAACLSWSSCKLDDYCSLCVDHTLCLYSGVGPECADVGEGGVTEKEKTEIVETHNWLRNIVAGGFESRGASGPQPKAANLRKLKWDDELAKVAQRWSDQCRFEHDTCRDDKRWKVGQNIYWKMRYPYNPVNWTEAIISWYDEVALFDANEVSSYKFDPNTGHYTQMIWHDTYAVGCGRRDYGYNKIYVCNYGPTGNWIGESLYAVGEPCSKCPHSTSCDELLCGSPKADADVTTPTTAEPTAASKATSYTPKANTTETTKDLDPRQDDNEVHHKSCGKGVHSTTTTTPSSINEDTNEIDGETRKGINKVVREIENLVKSVIKRYKAKA